MSIIARFQKDSESATPASASPQVDGVLAAIRNLVDTLQNDDKQKVLSYLLETLKPVSNRKAGEVLGAIVQFLPKKQSWTVADIKTEIEKSGTAASDKEVYNAVGYLTKTGRVTRVGYGRYIVNGVVFVTADDLGGQKSITEEDGDD